MTKIYTCKLGHKDNKNALNITWTNVKPPEKRGPRSVRDVIVGVPGKLKTVKARNANSPAMALSWFLTNEIVDIIVTCTNKRIAYTIQQISLSRNKLSGFHNETDAIADAIGLMYLRAALEQNHIH